MAQSYAHAPFLSEQIFDLSEWTNGYDPEASTFHVDIIQTTIFNSEIINYKKKYMKSNKYL